MSDESSKIAGAVSTYWAISISLVFVNKVVLAGDEDYKLDAPLFVTWFQCAVTVLCCYVLGGRFLDVPVFDVNPSTLKQILPLSIVFGSMIVFNNLCLKYVEVSFYQVARSLTMVFNVVLSYFVLKQATSARAIGCCAVVLFGFYLGNQSEINYSALGACFGVLSSIAVALNSILVKKYLALVDNNSWRITLYNNVNAVLLFLPLIVLSGEVQIIMESENLLKPKFWIMMAFSGFLGVAIGIATATQIKYTSPLTHNISGTAKAAFQTILSLYFFGNEITYMGLLSVFIVLAGSFAYAIVRRQEMAQKNSLPK